MGRLMIAELRRIAARRLVRLTVVLALVGIAVGGLAAFALSDSLSEEAYQAAGRRGRAAPGSRRKRRSKPACAPTEWTATTRSPTTVADECFPNESIGEVERSAVPSESISGASSKG